MKIYLDTNIYDFLIKQSTSNGQILGNYLRDRKHEVVVSKGIISETARNQDIDVREKALNLIRQLGTIYPRFPESYLEVQEIIREIKRCRSGWVTKNPDTFQIRNFLDSHSKIIHEFRKTGVFVVTDESFHQYIKLSERAVNLTNPVSKEIRQALLKNSELKVQTNNPRIQGILDSLPDEVERYWRLTSAVIWQKVLKGDPSMRDYRDWLLPYLGVRSLNAEDIALFWVRDVKRRAVPRTIVRCLTEYFQFSFRISHGNHEDCNHALYLLENDLFITGDKNFSGVLKEVVSESKIRLAAPVLVDLSNPNADLAIITAIETSILP